MSLANVVSKVVYKYVHIQAYVFMGQLNGRGNA